MVRKGQGEEEGSGFPNKRRHFALNLLRRFNHGRTVEDMSFLEPMIRRMVQESVEQVIDRYLSPSHNIQVHYPATRNLHLQFHSTLPKALFTGNPLLSNDKTRIKLVLYNSLSKQIVTCGPHSSLKVKIVVLDGDFDSDDREDWPRNEFDNKLVKNREGKRPLLTGEKTVALKDGVGYVGELSFTDNSKWSRSGNFRLGAKPHANSDEISIREGVSNAFRVKDHRGEAYKKHDHPALDDEVWRLKHIGKDGPLRKKLNDAAIFTVGDLLKLANRNQSSLRTILEVSNKAWDTIIGHARKCDVGEQLYMYRTTRGNLYFDSADKFVGVNFDGVNYLPADSDSLTSFQMRRLVEELKQQAYNNLAEWIPASDASSVAESPMLMGSVAAEGFANPNLGVLGLNFQEQDMNVVGPPYDSVVGQQNSSYHIGESSHCPPQGGFNPSFRNNFPINDPLIGFGFGARTSWCSEPHVAMDANFPMEASPWQGNGVFLDQGNRGIGIISSDSGHLMPKTGSPRTQWCKVLAVVKWQIVRRSVAARKYKNLYSYMQQV